MSKASCAQSRDQLFSSVLDRVHAFQELCEECRMEDNYHAQTYNWPKPQESGWPQHVEIFVAQSNVDNKSTRIPSSTNGGMGTALPPPDGTLGQCEFVVGTRNVFYSNHLRRIVPARTHWCVRTEPATMSLGCLHFLSRPSSTHIHDLTSFICAPQIS